MAGERHPIHPKCRMVVDHHRGSRKPFRRTERGLDVPRKDAGLECNWQAIGNLNSLIQLLEFVNAGHLTENLFPRNLGIELRMTQDRRRKRRLRKPFAADHELCATGNGLADPGCHAVRLARLDQRANLRLGRLRITDMQSFYGGGKTINELALDILMNQEAVGRDTHLSPVVIAALYNRSQAPPRIAAP